jgi:hypothetical protein
MEDVSIHFVGIRSIFHEFGIYYDHWVHFPPFGILYRQKPGNPGSEDVNSCGKL